MVRKISYCGLKYLVLVAQLPLEMLPIFCNKTPTFGGTFAAENDAVVLKKHPLDVAQSPLEMMPMSC